MVCGVPTIVSNFPEMGSFIDEFQCGWKTDVTLDSLYKLINQIDKTELDEKRRNALSASKAIRWQFEAQQMIKVYEGLVQQ